MIRVVSVDLDSLLERLEPQPAAADSVEGQRLHRTVRARLLDETVPETRIDRFVVTGRLGVGGMGVVYAAHDAQLDRRLAIKLVRHFDPEQREQDQQRLIREARALAQLSHPNVVTIYDVGLHDEHVFIAMELVAGATLRRWIGDGDRPCDEVSRCLLQAGEGLAAAHEAGIVHRDFKPDNVLVGDDGRVRVVDFGLAQGDGVVSTHGAISPDAMTSTSLTATGKVAGTPAYMAPEQLAGAPADPRTDQFAYCVACWEALYLERPYRATNVAQLRLAFADGVTTPSQPGRAPEWLRAVLARGLANDPGERWPSMRALLEAWSAASRRPRGRGTWKKGALALLGGVTLTLGGFAAWQSQRRAACEREAAAAIAVWNADADATMVAAFAGVGLAHARDSAERVGRRLDDYAATWAQTHERGCLANISAAIDDEAWQRRQSCLDDRRERLVTLLELLRAPDRDVVNAAVSVAHELPLAVACEDDTRLAAEAAAFGSAYDPRQVAAVRQSIARTELLADAIRSDAIPAALTVRERAQRLGDPGLVAESELAVGTAYLQLGEYQPAADAYERAYFAARPLGADDVALRAAIQLIDTVGLRLARFDDGLEWSRHAQGLLQSSGSARGWREADLAENVAAVLREKGDIDGARTSFERAIALRTEVSGADHPAVGRAWVELGAMLAQRGEGDDAELALGNAERVLVAAYGAESMQVAQVYSARCAVARYRGDLQESADQCAHALAIREAWLAPDHPSLAPGLSNLASARLSLGDLTGARALLVRAVDLRRRSLGTTHPSLATSLANLGVIDAHLGEPQAAALHFAEALEIRRQVLPPRHPDIASTLIGLGDSYQQMAEYQRALASYDEAVQISAPDGDARIHGRALTGRGLARLELGDPGQARADFEAALATPFGDEPDPTARCGLRHGLVRALVEGEGDGPRVRELARAAFDACREIGVEDAAILADLVAWQRGK